MAAVEGAEAGFGVAGVSGHRRAVAHSVRPHNPDQGHPVGNHPTVGNVHGFFYQYFINEHVLRFFNMRYPHDYNKMPALWYWLGDLVWIFPWSLFLAAVAALAWKTRRSWLKHLRHDAGDTVGFYLDHAMREDVASYVQRIKFRTSTIWLLSLFSAWTLVFFSISTNQEYYTFPVWPPLVILIAGVVAGIEEGRRSGGRRANAFDGMADGSAGGVRGARRGWPRRRLAGDCGRRAICRSFPTSAHCSRIAAWAITRCRCRTCSI